MNKTVYIIIIIVVVDVVMVVAIVVAIIMVVANIVFVIVIVVIVAIVAIVVAIISVVAVADIWCFYATFPNICGLVYRMSNLIQISIFSDVYKRQVLYFVFHSAIPRSVRPS